MLVFGFSSIQAQESAFEVFLPYEMDFLNPFGWQTSDGCFIINPGNNMFVKLSSDGQVVGETTYTIESSENVFTRIVSVLDIPNNPTSHLVVAEKTDLTAYPGICNIMHIFKINDDLSYNPEEVIVVDLSEEILNTGFYFMPRYTLEEDGSLLFATNATKLDDTSCLIIVLHIEFSPDVTPRQVELYDLQGRLVSIQNNGFESVETGQLPSGTYTMRILMEDGTGYSDKVVKQ